MLALFRRQVQFQEFPERVPFSATKRGRGIVVFVFKRLQRMTQCSPRMPNNSFLFEFYPWPDGEGSVPSGCGEWGILTRDISDASPSCLRIQMPYQLKSISYHFRPCRAETG